MGQIGDQWWMVHQGRSMVHFLCYNLLTYAESSQGATRSLFFTMTNVYDASGSGGTKKISGAWDVSSVVKVLPNVTSRSFG